MNTKLILAAAVAALSLGAGVAQAAPKFGVPSLDGGTATDERILVEMRNGGWSYDGPGPDYHMQQRPGPNCHSEPHPVHGRVCY